MARFTERTQRVVLIAQEEARRLRHPCIEPLHILSAIIALGEGVACQILFQNASSRRQLRDEIEKRFVPGDQPQAIGEIPFTPQAKMVLEHAVEEAREMGHSFVGTEYLLLGLFHSESPACILRERGFTPESIREEVIRVLGKAPDPPQPGVENPVISVIVEPKTKADEEKMVQALTALSKEDETLRIRTDVETGKTIVSGMSEQHLEIIVDRMRREFSVAIDVSKPRVAYRETIRKTVTEEAKFIRQSGGRHQYAHCILKIEPQTMNKGFVFIDDVRPDRIPRRFIPSIEKGVREALDGGALAGFPIIGIKVTLIDGSSHDEDSNEMAFKICGAMALRSGCRKADPTILEPIMKLAVTAPERYAGDVIGDLNSRRAKVSDMGDRGNLKFVECAVPLSAMFGYAAALRSLSQGSASFSMELSHYEEVPWDVYKASVDPHGPDEPPTASAGRPVRPIKPNPGLSGGESRPFPPEPDK